MKKYLLTALLATLSALMVWMLVPKEYSAQTTISDEFHETMLEVGIDRLEALVKDNAGLSNLGINNIETYCNILKSKDFTKRIPGCSSDNINYNINYRQQTMKIEYVDRNPEVAANILRLILEELQNVISETNHQRDCELSMFYQQNKDSAYALLKSAQITFARFSDAHSKILNKDEQTKRDELIQIVESYRKRYNDAEEDYSRHKMLTKRPYVSFVILKNVTTPVEDNSYPIGYILCFNILTLFAVKGWNLWRENRTTFFETFDWGNIFAPWTITICIWALILVLLAIDNVLDPLSEQFYVSLSLWLAIFLPTSILSCNMIKPSQMSGRNSEERPITESKIIEINQNWFNLLFIIAIIITPLYAYEVYKLISMFDLQDPLKSVRQLALFGDGYGILNYAYVFDLVLLIVGLWRYPKIPLWQLILIIFMWLIYATCNMAKGQFFILFISIIYVLFERKVIKIRTIFFIGLIVVGLFYLFNLAREDDMYRNNESFLDFIGMYVLSSSVAYGKVMRGITEHFGENVFWIFYYYGNKLFGTAEISHIQLQDFINVPVLTNVYTIFRPYFVDFGQIGVAMAALVLGVVSGVSYRYARQGSSFGICFYTYIIYVLVLQFFDDQILEGLGTLLQFILFLYLILQKRFVFTFRLKPYNASRT